MRRGVCRKKVSFEIKETSLVRIKLKKPFFVKGLSRKGGRNYHTIMVEYLSPPFLKPLMNRFVQIQGQTKVNTGDSYVIFAFRKTAIIDDVIRKGHSFPCVPAMYFTLA